MYNKVILIGRVGKEVEIRYTKSQTKVAKFSMATSKKYKGSNGERKEQTEWHNIICFGKLADIADEYVKKGSLIFVEGEINYNEYTGKDGVKKYFTQINANLFKMLDKKQQQQGGGNAEYKDNFTNDIQPPPNDFDESSVPF